MKIQKNNFWIFYPWSNKQILTTNFAQKVKITNQIFTPQYSNLVISSIAPVNFPKDFGPDAAIVCNINELYCDKKIIKTPAKVPIEPANYTMFLVWLMN